MSWTLTPTAAATIKTIADLGFTPNVGQCEDGMIYAEAVNSAGERFIARAVDADDAVAVLASACGVELKDG